MTRSQRSLDASELDLWVPTNEEVQALHEEGDAAEQDDSESERDLPELLTAQCHTLLRRYGGVILRGPPGTGKSYLANLIAEGLTNEPDRLYRIQFHPSYQYEDFVQGFQPTEEGGFSLADRTLRLACQKATEDPNNVVVLLIDELSRVDCARVFGEAFTYLERSKRGMGFYLPSGSFMSIPSNVAVIGTMNDRDIGVDALDAALERRFAMIELLPSETELVSILSNSTLSPEERSKVLAFFREANAGADGGIGLGHAYFYGIRDLTDLQDLWDHQLRFVLRRALTLDPDRHAQLVSLWPTTPKHGAGASLS